MRSTSRQQNLSIAAISNMQRGKALARMIEMYTQDDGPQQLPTKEWYMPYMDAIQPELRQQFYPSQIDEETYEFLNSSTSLSHSVCLQVYLLEHMYNIHASHSVVLHLFKCHS